jgi:hypothetical protein
VWDWRAGGGGGVGCLSPLVGSVLKSSPVRFFLPRNEATGNRNWFRFIQILMDHNQTASDRS